MNFKYLVTTKEDMVARKWEQLDFIIISGDAYVDHPSFGSPIIGRVLESKGYKVGIIPQPDWHSTKDFEKLGKPRLAYLVAAGNMDSMVNHYTVNKKRRKEDAYSPGGKGGLRPDRATIVYANKIREFDKYSPIILGGVEASLRRFAHYDYWDDKVRNSILVDSGADLLVYGMSENSIVEIADCLNDGYDVKYIRHVQGCCYMVPEEEKVYDAIEIPSSELVKTDKMEYANSIRVQYEEQNPYIGKVIIQKHGNRYLVQNPPALPLTQEALDAVYELPFTKTWHPMYDAAGGIPALQEVEFSIVSSRGCFGACSFCAITFHQGRIIQARSHESILREVEMLEKHPHFKGNIHDVGGPTANFRKLACKKQEKLGACKHRQCLHPTPCPNLEVDHRDYLNLLRKIRERKAVKRVFVRSGLRYDYMMLDKDETFFKELCQHHISGILKIAPEHIDDQVLALMGKPKQEVFDKFIKKYQKINKTLGKDQYFVPYLISSHPGSTLKSAINLALYLKKIAFIPEQVQDFYPTPGTLSTAMYYTGVDPRTMKSVYIPKTEEEKKMQRALLQFNRPENRALVQKALVKAGREDLIGNGKTCLIADISQEKSVPKTRGKDSGLRRKSNPSKQAKPKQNSKAKAKTVKPKKNKGAK